MNFLGHKIFAWHLASIVGLHCCVIMDGSKVYLDYNSTTPLEPEVHSTITEALTVCFANPSSSHEEGNDVHVRYDLYNINGHNF